MIASNYSYRKSYTSKSFFLNLSDLFLFAKRRQIKKENEKENTRI